MGFHATIASGVDAFGNARHKSAPRVRVTERVTGTAQITKFHQLAGPVLAIAGLMPDITPTMAEFAAMLLGRKITRLTATMNDWKPVNTSKTRWELRLRDLGYIITARKVTPSKRNGMFGGWEACLVKMGENSGQMLAQIPTGGSIDRMGVPDDCRRKALNVIHLIMQAQSN